MNFNENVESLPQKLAELPLEAPDPLPLWCTWVFFFIILHANFHTKSGVCSSRNEWVMVNFMIWRPFCFPKTKFKICSDSVAQEMSELCSILRFGGHFVFRKIQNLCSLPIQTSMQNLDSVAQEMSELCSILWFGSHFVFLEAIFLFLFLICLDCITYNV